uniref:Uncharacterized protein n=1 Tax=Amphimedon queenslandica TaxID=400682 RepID=A0A1X7STW6_AMPQE
MLSLGLYGAFTRFHIALRILFNGVTILHGFCLIAICILKRNRLNAFLAIVGLIYRFWVATKYTKLLRRPRAKQQRPRPQHPRDDGDNGDLALPRNNPGDHFYQDKDDSGGETYRAQKPEEDKSYNGSISFIVVNRRCLFRTLWINYDLFYTYCINLTDEQLNKLAVGFFMTVLYLLLCYMFVLFFLLMQTFLCLSFP